MRISDWSSDVCSSDLLYQPLLTESCLNAQPRKDHSPQDGASSHRPFPLHPHKIADGTFPRQVSISIHGAGWHELAVNRWVADPAGNSDGDIDRAAATSKAGRRAGKECVSTGRSREG